MITRHDDFSDLLGAYALDAVDPGEAAEIEAHLRTCAVCAQEVADHREVASLLAHSGTTAPEGMWDRIAAELSPPPPAVRIRLESDPEPAGPGAATVTDLGARRSGRSVPVKVFVAALSAAACLLVAFAVITVDQNRRLDKMETALVDTRTVPASERAVDVRLRAEEGDVSAEAVVDRDGVGRLYAAELPKVPDGEVYQLWGKVDGTVLSLGAFGSGAEVVPFQLDPTALGDVEAFMVTREQAPGAVTSSPDTVVLGTVA